MSTQLGSDIRQLPWTESGLSLEFLEVRSFLLERYGLAHLQAAKTRWQMEKLEAAAGGEDRAYIRVWRQTLQQDQELVENLESVLVRFDDHVFSPAKEYLLQLAQERRESDIKTIPDTTEYTESWVKRVQGYAEFLAGLEQ